MVKAHYKPVTPEQRGRELARELRALEQEEPGPERAHRLASFVRSAQEHRSLNLAMHAAELCLADDPDAPAALLDAYVDEQADLEEQLRALQDLRDLAGYVGRGDLDALADERLLAAARTWLADATEVERRHRLRRLTSILGRARVDDLRDELDAR